LKRARIEIHERGSDTLATVPFCKTFANELSDKLRERDNAVAERSIYGLHEHWRVKARGKIMGGIGSDDEGRQRSTRDLDRSSEKSLD
jgi:hypothetical protein